MKKFYYIFLILVSVMAVSCSEDGVTPHLKDTTLAFLPAAGDNSEEAQLRRDFYQTYGSFLLFNDNFGRLNRRRQLLLTFNASSPTSIGLLK